VDKTGKVWCPFLTCDKSFARPQGALQHWKTNHDADENSFKDSHKAAKAVHLNGTVPVRSEKLASVKKAKAKDAKNENAEAIQKAAIDETTATKAGKKSAVKGKCWKSRNVTEPVSVRVSLRTKSTRTNASSDTE